MPVREEEPQASPEWHLRREEGITSAERLLPASETVWLEDSIHDVPLQRPEIVAQIIKDHMRDGFFGT